MKRILILILLVPSLTALGQQQKVTPEPTLKSILLEQLRSTHNKAEWFVPASTAVDGLTAEQANWTDGRGNHSVGQLAAHLIYWNQRNLARFRGEAVSKFNNNDETFTSFDSARWNATVRQLDEVMTAWEREVEAADEQK